MLTSYATVYLCLPFTKRSSEEDDTFKKEIPEEMAANGQAQRPQPTSREASEPRGDSEKIPAGNEELPPHFERLIPTTEPLQSLRSLESKLKQRRWKL